MSLKNNNWTNEEIKFMIDELIYEVKSVKEMSEKIYRVEDVSIAVLKEFKKYFNLFSKGEWVFDTERKWWGSKEELEKWIEQSKS